MAFDFTKLDIPSPKRNRRAQMGWEGFFPYYAGFPESFAHQVLDSASLPRSACILDPWNGSGTTTFAASRLGLKTIGVDINPVMSTVARARTLPPAEADSLMPLANEILARAARQPAPLAASDPLNTWFGPSTGTWIRSVEKSVRDILIGEQTQSAGALEGISAIAATYYVGLFVLCRELATAFQATNPTWLRTRRNGQNRAYANKRQLAFRYEAIISRMCAALAARKHESAETGHVELLTGDTSQPSEMSGVADFILTSPPYCTRIDYTAATRIQLAILDPMIKIKRAELSLKMLGSIRVPQTPISTERAWGETCNEFLQQVSTHHSKASSGYYFKTHVDYFSKLSRSLATLSNALKPGAPAVLVVQDSYYKEIHNDLPAIVGEMAAAHDLTLRRRDNFHMHKTMASTHPHTRTYRATFEATEAVLCFERK